jgi:hypothetical protein
MYFKPSWRWLLWAAVEDVRASLRSKLLALASKLGGG